MYTHTHQMRDSTTTFPVCLSSTVRQESL